VASESLQSNADRLRDIESLVDARLARLGLEDLLVELLDRVREILGVDTAAILLLDAPNDQLVARAARGLEEEVYQASHVPLGLGFAGRIAATRRPATIEDIEDADVVNPVLRESGVRSLLGVPLLVGGDLLGVLHVGTVGRRRFDDGDVEVLQMVADRVALAARSSMSESERTASVVLQRSLLPHGLPRVAGLETAERYIPGSGGAVGGDWYDMFALPSGRVCITIGDVVGKGLRAAVVMGRLRTILRAYLFANEGEPAAALEIADRQLKHFERDEMATAIVAVSEPPFRHLFIATAGHPAPILATPERPGRYLDIEVGPPLGAPGAWPRRMSTVEWSPGAVICFYTDGLVERRGEEITDRIDAMCGVVTAAAPETVCATVMGQMIGPTPPGDDVALLVVRRSA
jgi:putative methionine-R-sulfoxide reductase with GAF domain